MILALVGAVQFVNILDFMIVMPLGPDFAVVLNIPKDQIPSIGGAYLASGSIAGIVGSVVLDRFDRRKALIVCLLGLFAGTASAAFVTGLHSLMAARLFAGLFGGPATSLAMSIVADVVPAQRRGRAMGSVMGAFAAASVLGVPAALELAHYFGWRSPFIVVALLGLAIAVLVQRTMPPMRMHLDARAQDYRAPRTRELLRDPAVLLSYAGTLCLMLSNFAIVPILSTYLQFNLGYPRDRLSLLYLCGGVVSFFGMRLVGPQVDRHGSVKVVWFATVWICAIQLLWFVVYAAWMPVLALFMAYMIFTSIRGVAFQTLITKVPSVHTRAGYMSLQSATSHLAAALGAAGSSLILVERPDESLAGMDTLAYCAIGGALCVPFLLAALQRRMDRAQQAPELISSSEV
jgi:predicted MFS family arabinose efflux permease